MICKKCKGRKIFRRWRFSAPAVYETCQTCDGLGLQPGSMWVKAIRPTPITDRHDLVWKRPIIAWFSIEKKAVRRLIKLSGRCGNDEWMVQGRDDEQGQDLDVTPASTTLDHALRYLTFENGWVLCEFKNEIEFYTGALLYLQEK